MNTPDSVRVNISGERIGVAGAVAQQILSGFNLTQFFRSSISFYETISVPCLFDIVTTAVGLPLNRLEMYYDGAVLVYRDLVILVDSVEKPFKEKKRFVTLTTSGDPETVKRVQAIFDERFKVPEDRSILWGFMTPQGPFYKHLTLEVKNVPKDSFYPWIRGGIDAFFRSYMESDSSLLLLLGEPGSGKTTLIRHFIHHQKLSTVVTYDEEMMSKDQFFADFIARDNDLMVLEDADVLLRSRVDGNRTMNKLLNTSDGLIPMRKKIIMTANIAKLDEIDQALIRPGRCFETLMFRELSLGEARQVAADMDLPEPTQGCSLSKLFTNGPTGKSDRQVGFTLP